MNDQDDHGYTGPAVLRTLTWAPRVTHDSVIDEPVDDSHLPMPLRASQFSPRDFDFGKLTGMLDISDDEPSGDRLEKVAINFVKASQFFGGGQWIDLSSSEYSQLCNPRKVSASERSLLIELTLRKCLVAKKDGAYGIGPHMAFFLSRYIVPESVAA